MSTTKDDFVPYALPSDITYLGEGVSSQKAVLRLRPTHAIDEPGSQEQDLAQKILGIIQEAHKRASKVPQKFAGDFMYGALDDIRTLCEEQLAKREN